MYTLFHLHTFLIEMHSQTTVEYSDLLSVLNELFLISLIPYGPQVVSLRAFSYLKQYK